MAISRIHFVLENPWQFARRVILGFRANQGFLLAGAIAYYTLLTIVPMFVLILAGLSQIQEVEPLLETLRSYLMLLSPGQADALIDQISAFLQNWKTVGLMGILLLLFFSSFAFTSLESAMSVIFFHRVARQRRHFLISAIIPFCYILILAIGMLVIGAVSGSLHSLDARTVMLLGYHWSFSGVEAVLVYILGMLGEILLLTSLYLVMPVGKLSLRHALIGGITAAVLWEITRSILVWYFSTLSLVNVIYGTFATVIIILLTLEAGAIILLLGAQVIAEYERIGSDSTKTHGLQT
jgi:membrane protein